jgi:hypothetical protein
MEGRKCGQTFAVPDPASPDVSAVAALAAVKNTAKFILAELTFYSSIDPALASGVDKLANRTMLASDHQRCYEQWPQPRPARNCVNVWPYGKVGGAQLLMWTILSRG